MRAQMASNGLCRYSQGGTDSTVGSASLKPIEAFQNILNICHFQGSLTLYRGIDICGR